MNIKKNDDIIVLAGKDKGKTGKVEKVLAKQNSVIIAGINIFKKHKKDQNNSAIIDIVKPLDASKIALVCPKCHKPTRIGFQALANGGKSRICKKCGEAIA